MNEHADSLTSAARIGYKVRAAYKVMRRVFAQKMDAVGIPYAYYRCLRPLLAEDGVTQTQLSLRSGIDTSAATAIIDKMVAAGLVRRDLDSADRRKRLIFLTSAGRRFCEPLADTLVALDRAFMEGIEASEYRVMSRVLDKLILNCEELERHEGIFHEGGKTESTS